MAKTPAQEKSNRRLALTLLSIAIVFGVGFVSKIMLYGF